MASRFKEDLIVRNQILAAQKYLEEKARREWHQKWGFYLDFDKILIEEAKKRGLSEEDYKRIVTKRKDKSKMYMDCVHIKPSGEVPSISSGFVGWRSNFNLDRLAGPLHINPKYTLPHEFPQKYIFLG